MKNLAKAIINVMKDVKNISKNTTVGGGSFAYKGVSDKDVKETYKNSMSKNGLCILPIDIDAKTTIERWEETNNYGTKQKQLVFSEVKTRYLLLHDSGESQEISGYGHGTDAMDKAAGKATTYALKYALLYTFMTPTGDIEDTDTEHSNNVAVPQQAKPKQLQKKKLDDNQFKQSIKALKEGTVTVSQFTNYELTTLQSKIFTETLVLIGK
jgi:hypothetical protein